MAAIINGALRAILCLGIIVIFYGCGQALQNNVPTPLPTETTRDSLLGVWIDEDTVEQHHIEIDADSIYYFNATSPTGSERYFIAGSCMRDKTLLSPATKNGSYFIVYSSLIDNIDHCEKINLLTNSELVFFNADQGKQGLFHYYRKAGQY